MRGRFASIRFTLYIGLSILGISETYRLLLLYLPFVIQVPLLTIVLEYIVLWMLFLGILISSIGFIGIKRADPPLLDQNEYSINTLRILYRQGIAIGVVLGILILLPPTTSFKESFQLFFQMVVSMLWAFYYAFMTHFVPQFSSFHKKESITNVLRDKILILQVFLGLILFSLWFANSLTLLLNNNFIFLVYMSIMVFYLLLQSYFFLKATRFAYLIQG